MFSVEEIKHISKWAAQECSWQISGELSVSQLVDAVLEAREWELPITPTHIIRLGTVIAPAWNHDRFRLTGVVVGSYVAPGYREVPRLIDNLIEVQEQLSPTEFFKEFEEIHPFRDGNGRTGAILWNWLEGNLEGSLTKLQFPPNLFADSRRVGIQLESEDIA